MKTKSKQTVSANSRSTTRRRPMTLARVARDCAEVEARISALERERERTSTRRDIAAIRRDLAETRAIMIARDAPPLGYTSPAVTAEDAAALATMTEQEIQIIRRMPITPAAYVRTRDALAKVEAKS